MLLVSLNLVFMHGLQPKKKLTHSWQFLTHFASKFKNYRLKTNRQTIGRSFSLQMADGMRTTDELSELVALLRKIDLAPSATTEEKFFTWILHGLKRGSIHTWWDLICSQGIFKANNNDLNINFSEEIVKSWYTDQSFVGSPGYEQISCLLKPLSYLFFHFEVTSRSTLCPIFFTNQASREYLEELDNTHELFSWEL